MRFNLERSIEILECTPSVLESLLKKLSYEWLLCNEGENTWNSCDVVRHLIHMERTNWIPRIKAVYFSNNGTLEALNSSLPVADNTRESIQQLMNNFKSLRKSNVITLNSMRLSQLDLRKTCIHPDLGQITMMQLLSAWTVHDLAHIGQIVRVMAKQYKEEVGPWIAYLKILKQ